MTREAQLVILQQSGPEQRVHKCGAIIERSNSPMAEAGPYVHACAALSHGIGIRLHISDLHGRDQYIDHAIRISSAKYINKTNKP
jgi:hypothetical protein